MATDDDLLKIANDSGFPLQIAVRQAVEAARHKHGWKVPHAEHAWSNAADGKSGFIDLVLRDSQDIANIVVECKRVRDAAWLFFNSAGSSNARLQSKAWASRYDGSSQALFGWADVPIDPKTPEAHFCAVRGQSPSDKNALLERVAAEVISSTEALAAEERDYREANEASLRLYFNAIVTTATLHFADFLPADLSVSTGTLARATFQEVPFVRVRKQFSLRPIFLTPQDWQARTDTDRPRENTVFVINSNHVNKFLSLFDIPAPSMAKLGY